MKGIMNEQLIEKLEAMAGRKCLPEGELHVCWLVEETIVGTDLWGRYLVEMETTPWNELVHATWQHRAEALIKVKGQK